jgi:Tfp pilus assembly protein PilW
MTTRISIDRRARPRRGFSMAELIIGTLLTSLLGLLIGTAVATFVRPVVEIDGRTRLAVEARHAAESLARDFSGYLSDVAGDAGDLTQYACQWPPVATADGVSLTFSGADDGPVEVSYSVQDKVLHRRKTVAGVETDLAVARYVGGFSAAVEADETVTILLTLRYPDAAAASTYFSCTYKLIGMKPSP